jgi:hypothetical protein
MNNKEKNNRRNFLKNFFSAGASIGLASSAKTITHAKTSNKVKMLTADGKLVEIDKSVLEKKKSLKRASDKEVFDWMTSKRKT